jgi:Cu(I)/Ag(I) efflux system membrane protein CusA/SilA
MIENLISFSLNIEVNRDASSRYGLAVDEVNIVESAIGGSPIGETIERRQRFTINLRLAQNFINSIEQLNRIPIKTQSIGTIPLFGLVPVIGSTGVGSDVMQLSFYQ